MYKYIHNVIMYKERKIKKYVMTYNHRSILYTNSEELLAI